MGYVLCFGAGLLFGALVVAFAMGASIATGRDTVVRGDE